MDHEAIAIVGMAGRFPGAPDLDQLWRNLRGGVESITFFSERQLLDAGVAPSLLRDPAYVRAAGWLEDADRFDAGLFGYTPREAALLDPQHRLFLECAWAALEDAGHLGGGQEAVGVFAGADANTYLHSLQADGRALAGVDPFQLLLSSDKDYLATRTAYELDLRGPAVTVQSACSTSLAAVHLACQSLLSGECDVALAGGVSVGVPLVAGYLYQEGGIHSPDGHCRPFDADARGTVGGSGVGVVVLRRLSEAVAGDTVRAVIRGTAMNNDGARKLGYAAPSVDGQAAVIREALGVARVRAREVSYIEAHGTATPLGDPIELAALSQAFRPSTREVGFCRVGAIKSNIGHLGAAAGVAGLIKTVLALQRREIPPTLHFRRPSPRLELEGSPFRIAAELSEWASPSGPRRAGVSSFGIGGTNVHAVLEEAPPPSPAPSPRPAADGRPRLLLLSAASAAALDGQARRLASHLREHPDLALEDVAHTLQVGRRTLAHRRAVVCRDLEQAVAALERGERAADLSGAPPDLEAVAARWLRCEDVELPAAGAARARRVPLPTYPFERDRHWIEARPAPEGAPPPAPPAAPTQDLDAEVRALIARQTGGAPEGIDPDLPFTELGFDSLGLMQLSEAIEARFGHPVPFRRLLEDLPTARHLAAHVAAAGPVRAPARSAAPAEPAAVAAVAAGPYRPASAGSPLELDARQRAYLEKFVARYNARTAGSKQRTQAHRARLSDNRVAARFRTTWKELVYPVVSGHSAGARLRDVDGNEYVDLTMGFGVNLFGHSPQFVVDAIRRQLSEGLHLGPQPEAAGPIAERICELTGVERVAFCNSGTEAVMTALRVARTVTRRQRVVMFAGSYHGHFDGTLARAVGRGADRRTVPLAPGIPAGMVEDVLVLEYGDPEALELIRAQGDALAAVLVEPVQSRRPHLQPRDFLHALREITDRAGTALIFDEMITGFRCHPGGAQAWFGVQADIVTYGKILGGGLPIGAVAGRDRFLDAIDGGGWSYGDDSAPGSEQTFFAGTFCKHPLALAAAGAVLDRLRAEGPGLQERLNARTAALADRVNGVFREVGVPLALRHFSSWFVLEVSPETPFLDLALYHLLERGLYVWEGGTCFLSTAHTDADLDQVVGAFRASVEALAEVGFLPRTGRPRALPVTEGQRQLWMIAQMGRQASAAYNECATLRLRGPLDTGALRGALAELVARHDALRTTFTRDGEQQIIHPRLEVPLGVLDLPAEDREGRLAQEVKQRAAAPFDLEAGPLVRVDLLRSAGNDHLMLIVIHHLVTDAFSMGVLLEELAALYAAAARGQKAALPPPAPAPAQGGGDAPEDLAYWLEALAGPPADLELPVDRPRPRRKTFAGGRLRREIDPRIASAVRDVAAAHGATTFATLLAGYTLLLHHLSRQDDLIVGIHAAGQSRDRVRRVGYFVQVLPFRSRVTPALTFAEHLAATRRRVLDAYDHQRASLSTLAERLRLRHDPARSPLVSAAFNVERPAPPLDFGDLRIEPDAPETDFAKRELSLNVFDEARLVFDWTYNSDLFLRSTVERWAHQIESLLAAVARTPAATVADLDRALGAAAAAWRERTADDLARRELEELRGLKRR
jgi:glutamate-1-semialdehyde aminotransferase/3-oxoacyl-(acyl-carrier-protein) synthase/acyl carrier protein